MRRKLVVFLLIFIVVSFAVVHLYQEYLPLGIKVDSLKGVAVYFNGFEYTQTYGKHYALDGYYYGQKWQCVEFVKRFYYDAKGHAMPDLFGHAKDFFDSSTAQGRINKRRGLLQFYNGGNIKPQVDDLVVFTNGRYGHVAIVSEVGEDYIEIIQQNTSTKTREKLKLLVVNQRYYVGGQRKPAGWLRIP